MQFLLSGFQSMTSSMQDSMNLLDLDLFPIPFLKRTFIIDGPGGIGENGEFFFVVFFNLNFVSNYESLCEL